MTADTAPIFPDDLYATKEDGQTAAPQPLPERKPISPFRFVPKREARRVVSMPSVPERLPDADLPLFTPQAPDAVVTAQGLVDRVSAYLPSAEVEKIREAYRYADNAHLGQFRKSGEPYITHPIAVASILASWKMDAETIEAGLMHDVLEDTAMSKREMTEKFGTEVAELVDGVSKLDKLRFSSNEIAQAESFRKMLLAMSRDVRVILVKLADRLHNMRTLGVMRPEKRARIAKETLDIYVPIAHRLGLNTVFRELQELAFANRYPLRYQVLYAHVLKTREARRAILERIMNETKASLAKAGMPCRILGRDKTIYGIYNKMREKHQSFSDALDIYGFRLIVKNKEDCYITLGLLHALYKPVHARFKDFIAIPKANGYQSLHTTVIGPDGTPIEYQIRTEEMHRIDEDGILVHWLYNSDADEADLQTRTAAWLQSLLEIQSRSKDSQEFLENIKVDLFPNRIYVFTPKGRIISLPKGSTAIDFAYGIHTDVGGHAEAVRVNGETKPLSVPLKNGDMVQIITNESAHPAPQWLGWVHSGKARAEIRQYLRNCRQDDALRLGRIAFEELADAAGITLYNVPEPILEKVLQEFGVETVSALYRDIGLGKALAAAVLHRTAVLLQEGGAVQSDKALPPVIVNGNEGIAQHLAACCHPIPGDRIVGLNRPGVGITVHRADCPHAERGRQASPSRWMSLEWGAPKAGAHFAVPLEIWVDDKNAGLAAVATAVSEAKSSLSAVTLEDTPAAQARNPFKLDERADKPAKGGSKAAAQPSGPVVKATVQVRDRDHLVHVVRTIRQCAAVRKVKRLLDD